MNRKEDTVEKINLILSHLMTLSYSGYKPFNPYTYIYIYIYIYIFISWPTVVEGDPTAPFSIATTSRCSGGSNSFPWIAPLTLGSYLIMLSVKQGGIKYHFFSLWYDSTWDRTPVFQTIGEHSITYANGYIGHLSTHQYIYISYIWRIKHEDPPICIIKNAHCFYNSDTFKLATIQLKWIAWI